METNGLIHNPSPSILAPHKGVMLATVPLCIKQFYWKREPQTRHISTLVRHKNPKMSSNPPDLVQWSAQEMLLPKKLHFPLKGRWANGCVDFIEGIHCKLGGRKYIHALGYMCGANLGSCARKLTLMYKSYTSLKKILIPSSCRTSWSMINLICEAEIKEHITSLNVLFCYRLKW